MAIKLGIPHQLKIEKHIIIVVPFDGETIGQPGISHGFVHYNNYLSDKYKGFCGTDYFEKNAVILTEEELKDLSKLKIT